MSHLQDARATSPWPHDISQRGKPCSELALRQSHGKSVWSGPQVLVDWATHIFPAISLLGTPSRAPGIRNIPCSVLPSPNFDRPSIPYTVYCQPSTVVTTPTLPLAIPQPHDQPVTISKPTPQPPSLCGRIACQSRRSLLPNFSLVCSLGRLPFSSQ